MKINKLIVEKNFMYIWLKKIENVDLSKHCAKCLIGEYNSNINKETKIITDLEIEKGIYYLCGVSEPYVWKNNFHLAFKEKLGNTLIINKKGIYIEIEDAEEIIFSDKDIDNHLKEANQKQFYTCRNWQFANKFNASNSK